MLFRVNQGSEGDSHAPATWLSLSSRPGRLSARTRRGAGCGADPGPGRRSLAPQVPLRPGRPARSSRCADRDATGLGSEEAPGSPAALAFQLGFPRPLAAARRPQPGPPRRESGHAARAALTDLRRQHCRCTAASGPLAAPPAAGSAHGQDGGGQYPGLPAGTRHPDTAPPGRAYARAS